MKHLPALLEIAREAALAAGQAALAHHGGVVEVRYKSDDSPLTRADTAAHEAATAILTERTPELPILSEESAEPSRDERRRWDSFWIVDPLDGSKEFLKGTGEFTVNVALVRAGEPVLGVVHVPVSGATYAAVAATGDAAARAWLETGDGQRRPLRTRRADPRRLTVVASKDHAGPRVTAFLASLDGAETASLGSSLKFCRIAEGRADFYPRVVPTMEWDTAAAQCIVEAAGGAVTDLQGRRLTYNKDDLRNPSILAFGDPAFDWVARFQGSGPDI